MNKFAFCRRFLDFPLRIWNYFDDVLYFVFHFVIISLKQCI